mgnify:FL=1
MFLFLPEIFIALQPRPVDLPLKSPFEDTRKNNNESKDLKIDGIENNEEQNIKIDTEETIEVKDLKWLPKIVGEDIPYSKNELKEILKDCKEDEIATTLNSCASRLTAVLIQDGYVNSRVYTIIDEEKGTLEVIMGKVVELTVKSDNPIIKERAFSKLKDLIGKTLHTPELEKKFAEVRNIKNVGQISGNLGRLGSDPTKAVLNLTVDYMPSKWQREFSHRNDGSSGTGQWRNMGTFVKTDILKKGDTFIGMVEINNDQDIEIGSQTYSGTYTFPLENGFSSTNSISYSRSDFVEFEDDLKTMRFDSLTLLFQVDKSLVKKPNKNLSASFGLNISNSESFLTGVRTPLSAGSNPEGYVRTGYLKASLNYALIGESILNSGNISFQQGIAGISESFQLTDYAANGIYPGESRALGVSNSLVWTLSNNLGLNLNSSAQVALNSLISGMSFSVDGSSGLKGLPKSVASGDSGWLSDVELVFTSWAKEKKAIQILPFFGFGEVITDVQNTITKDSAGSYGLLLRYINSNNVFEIGLANFIKTDDNTGTWNNWMLGDGIFSNLKFTF